MIKIINAHVMQIKLKEDIITHLLSNKKVFYIIQQFHF